MSASSSTGKGCGRGLRRDAYVSGWVDGHAVCFPAPVLAGSGSKGLFSASRGHEAPPALLSSATTGANMRDLLRARK